MDAEYREIVINQKKIEEEIAKIDLELFRIKMKGK